MEDGADVRSSPLVAHEQAGEQPGVVREAPLPPDPELARESESLVKQVLMQARRLVMSAAAADKSWALPRSDP